VTGGITVITGIGHVAFRITDLDRALAFYRDILGLREAFRLDRDGEPSPWIVYLQVAPGDFIELFPGAETASPQPGRDAGYNHFCLLVDDIQATVRDLGARGLSIDGEPTKGIDNNYQYWITDPDGNRIELMQIMDGSPHATADARWATASAATR
jgi:catechol 2,3-dioxygenase-like lactoylglutathione lyase family enzyme